MSPLPLYSCYFGSNSAFFEMTDVYQCIKEDFLFLSLCLQNDLIFRSLLLLITTLSTSRASPILCPLRLSHPEFSSLEASEWTCAPNYIDSLNCSLSLRCDLHDLLVEQIPNAFSRVFMSFHDGGMLCLVVFVGFCGLASSFPQPIWAPPCSHFARHSRVHETPQLCSSVFNVFLALSIFRIYDRNACQLSSIFRALDFQKPIPAPPFFSELLSTCRTNFQDTNNPVWELLECV